jgi:hypothetical protein
MTNSIIAIKGNHLNKATSIFETFNYVDNKNDKQFDSWDKTARYLFDNYFELANKKLSIRGIWFDNGWTIICDPEMVDSLDDKIMETLSQNFKSDVFSFLIQTTSGSFGFAKYAPNKQRHFFSTDGQVTDNEGPALVEESGLNFNEKIFIDDIAELAGKLGVDMDPEKTKTTFIVKELGYNEVMKEKLAQYSQKPKTTNSDTKKPWWKVW